MRLWRKPEWTKRFAMRSEEQVSFVRGSVGGLILIRVG